MDIDKILENNKSWVAEKLEGDKAYFDKLSEGQSPKILYIGCSDSRVPPEQVMGAEPGEVFVHRNIGNMVISVDLNAMSVITYAIEHLKVEHVIVCGHYGCGAVLAAMKSDDLGVLSPWLRNIRDVHHMHKDALDAISNEKEKYERLIELNVQEQCVNLLKTAVVQKAVHKRGLKIHSWVFNIHEGLLKDLKFDLKSNLETLMATYKLD